MMDFHRLALQPAHFHGFTGLTVEEATTLAAVTRPDWEAYRKTRVKVRRQRKMGGGRKLGIPEFKDRLLVFLIYAKLYPTYAFLEYLFDVDQTNICHIVKEMAVLLSDKIIINRHHKRIRSLADLKAVMPALDEVIVDATEQKVNRPAKKRTRKAYHSGKKKAFTIKTQIVTTRQKIIVHVAGPSPGRTHDYRYFQTTTVPQWLEDNPQIKARMDLGYVGINKDYPQARVILPTKRNRWKKELTRSEKIMNTKKAKARIAVENTLANLKKFKILSDTYRNVKEHYSAIFKSVAFLSNFRTLERLAG